MSELRPAWHNDARCDGNLEFEYNREHAARMCAQCPVRAQCYAWASTDPGGFDGIAAGHMWVNGKPRQPAWIVELTAEDMREAHVAFNRGDRDQWVVEGERAYNRARKRAQRGAA